MVKENVATRLRQEIISGQLEPGDARSRPFAPP
jgi:DNA-binding GntR family transcriptional regulator